MPRLILHVGLHKTATTHVQEAMAGARAELARHGVIYPACGPHTGHHGFFTDWLNLPAPYHLPGGGRAALTALAADPGGDVLFLSSEEMSRAGGPGGRMHWAELREIFAGWEVTLLCVLRVQWRFLQAVWLEIARSRTPPPPPALVARALETGQVDGLWCDFAALYDGFRADFDGSEIRLADYATLCAAPGGVLGAMHAACGLPPDIVLPGRPGGAPVRANPSPPALASWAARAIAGGQGADTHLTRTVEEAFALEYGAGRPGTIFTHDELDRIAARFAPGNARLAPLIGAGALDPARPDGLLTRADANAALWLRAARRLWLRAR